MGDVEKALRFRETRRSWGRTTEAVNAAGYRIRRGGHQARFCSYYEFWDVFSPSGEFLGLEPTKWWAMKLADVHYMKREP